MRMISGPMLGKYVRMERKKISVIWRGLELTCSSLGTYYGVSLTSM
jgi:hypothetical protein